MALYATYVRRNCLLITQVFRTRASPSFNQNCWSPLIKTVSIVAPFAYVINALRNPSPRFFIVTAKDTSDELWSPIEIRRRKKEEIRRQRLIDLVDAKNSKEDHQSARRLLEDFKSEETDDPRVWLR